MYENTITMNITKNELNLNLSYLYRLFIFFDYITHNINRLYSI